MLPSVQWVLIEYAVEASLYRFRRSRVPSHHTRCNCRSSQPADSRRSKPSPRVVTQAGQAARQPNAPAVGVAHAQQFDAISECGNLEPCRPVR